VHWNPLENGDKAYKEFIILSPKLPGPFMPISISKILEHSKNSPKIKIKIKILKFLTLERL
jgi:hypothetical protein